MTILGLLIDRMILAGMLPSDAGAVAAEIYAAGVASASIRSPGAERTRRWRHKASQSVTEYHNDKTSPNVTERHKASQSDVSIVLPIDTNIKKDKRQNSERASRGTRIGPDWTPSPDDRTLAKQEGFSESEIDREALRFRDYWTGRAGSGGVKLDWGATWRNWIRTSGERLGKTPKTPANGPQVNGSGFYAKFGSEEQDAWDCYGRETRKKAFPRDKNGGWNFPSQWPPGYKPQRQTLDIATPPLQRMDS